MDSSKIPSDSAPESTGWSMGKGSSGKGSDPSGHESDSDENILIYLKKLGLSDEQNCLVLTAHQHYYYNEEDLSNIKTLVNLKKLNQIKDPDKFLHNLFRILPPNSNFIGCFSDSEMKPNDEIHGDKSTGLLNWFINLLERRSEHRISRNGVYELLESHGFRIFDMKQICGLTFFYSKNARKQLNYC